MLEQAIGIIFEAAYPDRLGSIACEALENEPNMDHLGELLGVGTCV
jgi:hypothetical protein